MIANSASITIDANADIHYNANADIHYNANVKDNPKTQGQILDSGANDASAVAARAESHLTVAARERGLNIKELAALMGVGPSHLSQVARGKKALTLYMRGKIQAVLGEVPPQGVVHRQGGVVRGGESTYLRERARERGMTLRQVADRTGLTYGYVVQVSRGAAQSQPSSPGPDGVGPGRSGEDRGRSVPRH